MNCGQCGEPRATRVKVSDGEVRNLCNKCKGVRDRAKNKYEVKYTKAGDLK